MLYVDVSLLHTGRTCIDRVQRPRREDIVGIIVDQCERLVAQQVNGRIHALSQSDFNSDGMTVHLTVVAEDPQQPGKTNDLAILERFLESSLQSHFGWKHAAISVQIEVDASSATWRDCSLGPRAAHEVGAVSPRTATEPVVVNYAHAAKNER